MRFRRFAVARDVLFGHDMRTLLVAAVAGLALCSTTVDARPITVGIGLGVSQSEADSNSGIGASQTLGLWGRLGFSSRVAGQLEVARYSTEDGSDVTIRNATALLVVDLMDRGPWMPILIAGLGLDSADDGFSTTSGHHIEGGLGIEYRSDGGLTVGTDIRLGGRSIDSQPIALDDRPGVTLFAPSRLREGEYRAARIVLGIRF